METRKGKWPTGAAGNRPVTFDEANDYEVRQRAKRKSAKRDKTKRRRPKGLRREKKVSDMDAAGADGLRRRAWAERVGPANM